MVDIFNTNMSKDGIKRQLQGLRDIKKLLAQLQQHVLKMILVQKPALQHLLKLNMFQGKKK